MGVEASGLGRSHSLVVVLACAALAIGNAADLAAQAVCSAPHSSPTLAQSGAIRTLPPGAGWVQLSVYGQHASERYEDDGSREPFTVTGAEFHTRSLFLTAAVGVLPGLEIWGQVPGHRLTVSGSSTLGGGSTGVGDLRAAVRVSPELFGVDLPMAVRAGAKTPASDFDVDPTVIPLSEGQNDFEVSVESGSSLGSLPLYVFGWIGYRWRSQNAAVAFEPGDERFAHVAVGGTARGLTWELAADGLWGEPPVVQGRRLPREQRRLLQLFPTLGYGVGPGRLEATGQLPLGGRNLPAALGLSVGYRVTWGT